MTGGLAPVRATLGWAAPNHNPSNRQETPLRTAPIRHRHCPSCRQTRPTKTLARVVIGAEHSDVVECQETSCQLRWCLSRRALHPVEAAA